MRCQQSRHWPQLRNVSPVYPVGLFRLRETHFRYLDGLWPVLNVAIGRKCVLAFRATNLTCPWRDCGGLVTYNLSSFPPAVIYLDIWPTAAVFPHIIACAHISMCSTYQHLDICPLLQCSRTYQHVQPPNYRQLGVDYSKESGP